MKVEVNIRKPLIIEYPSDFCLRQEWLGRSHLIADIYSQRRVAAGMEAVERSQLLKAISLGGPIRILHGVENKVYFLCVLQIAIVGREEFRKFKDIICG